MFDSFQYAYLLLDIPFVVAWFILYLVSKKTRKEQLIMSLLFLPAGTIGEILYFQDYWSPASVFSFSLFGVAVLIEDLIFSFSIAGFASVIYEVWRGKKLVRINKKVQANWMLLIAICLVISLGLFSVGVNSIFATSISLVVGALFIILSRYDLFEDAVLSGIGVMFLMFLSYQILYRFVFYNPEVILKEGWLLYGSSFDLRIFDIPVTEMIWGFSFGMIIGPFYEFIKGVAIKKGKKIDGRKKEGYNKN